MKMKTVLLPAKHASLYMRVNKVLKRGFTADSHTRDGRCCVITDEQFASVAYVDSFKHKPLASTEIAGGKRAKPDSFGPIILTLPAYLVRDDAPEYKVKK